ncbi:GyrI-like domain-containing protein [Ammoniphilus sp. YIM 78166]|uniref:GyrI-like domain-containing protein n=1 Tax=Ammoniphilus sp. YIM 78166 TaxID=1644106 RepID=UPI00106FE524|nr:GyrI-like domain-containing protein [Ammoniphilus sp. YIM 78166]
MERFFQVNLEGAEQRKYQIVKRDAFQAVGVKRECSCGAEAGAQGIPELWDEVNNNGTANMLVELMNGEFKGLLGITDNYDAEKNTIDYWIAAEHIGELLNGLSIIQFPASKWVVFEVYGPTPIAMPKAWKQIFSEWIPSNRYDVAEIPAIEAYIDPDPHRADSSNQIWLAVK